MSSPTPRWPQWPFQWTVRAEERWLLWAWPMGVLSVGLLALIALLWAQTPQLTLAHPQPSRIWSADRVLLATLAPDDYEAPIAYDSLPPHITQALLAAVEPDYRRQRWRWSSAYSRMLVRQQEALLRPPLRSVKRQLAAIRLERTYPADTILAAVLERADWGMGRRGLTRASWFYLGKSPQELSVDEAALLMGMLEAPSAFNPRRDSSAARRRRNEVLAAMADRGDIPLSLRDSLQQVPLRIAMGKTRRRAPSQTDSREPYFTRLVTAWVESHLDSLTRAGFPAYDLTTDGLDIYTTLDSRIQAHARAAVLAHLRFLDEPFRAQLRDFAPWRRDTAYLPRAMRRTRRYRAMLRAGEPEAAIFRAFRSDRVRMRVVRLAPDRSKGAEWGAARVVMADTTLTPLDSLLYYTSMLQASLLSAERGTNRVVAYVAGLDYTYLPLDHLTQTRRQPGSAFKPFVYAAALQAGIEPCTDLPNQRMVIETPEGPWSPRNSEGESDPLLSMKCALAFSINRVAVHLSEQLGRERVAAAARKFGVVSPIRPVPAVALGTSDVSVWEMTEAYATLANLGQHQPLRLVDQLTVAGRRDPLPLPHTETEQVYPAPLAYTLIDMLRAVVTYGTAGTIKRQFNLYSIDLAGKTGTTQNHSDGWFMNLTPELVTGIWVGCDDRRVRFQYMYYGRGAMTAMPIGGKFLQKVYSDKRLGLPKGKFEPPTNLPYRTDCSACPNFSEPAADSTASDTTANASVDLNDDEVSELEELGFPLNH